MGQSYRIRTELGVNKTINVQLDQEFEFLEILSLKIQQSELYTRSCSDYGVIVGRITANNGLGIPNARVSIFIPITPVDESNPIISSIYPYKSPTDKNEDGYRYNLLPYEKSYSTHAASGTLPTRSDVLTESTAVEIFDTYYRYTSKTNESGDYMIMGVPLGDQTVVMDVDLSDIGEFSLTPQDLIRMGLATESQVAGSTFRSSTDLNSLPQIISLTKNTEISPLWGDPTICQIAVNRLDFDLRDDANVDIQPTSVFMGSIFTAPDNFRIRKNCRPRDNMGNLCELQAGPGQILAIRQTIQQDENGNPVLEQYELEQSGNVIDGDGTWLVEVPMNLDYIVTNEFGEKTLSNDPTLGVPTRAKYRFKIKWKQNTSLTEMTRRAYFLVPNVKEYGWNTSNDPNYLESTTTSGRQLSSSYYFGLAWSGYTDGFIGDKKIERLNEIIDCNDTFYQFDYNKVYTVSGLIDEYKNGLARGRFLGIKEIDSQDCDSTVNKFPVNDGFRNFDLIYFLFSIIFQVIQLFGVPLLVIYHFIAFLWNNFAVPLLVILIALVIRQSVQYFIAASVSFPALGLIVTNIALGVLMLFIGFKLIQNFSKVTSKKFGRFKIPMITYPDCQACDCEPETTKDGDGALPSSTLTQLSSGGLYYEKMLTSPVITDTFKDEDEDVSRQGDREVAAISFSQTIGTRATEKNNNTIYKSTESDEFRFPVEGGGRQEFFSYSKQIPLGERINIFNTRKKYFDGVNKISVTFDVTSNVGINHFDNTITVLGSQLYESGQLLTFVNPESTTDINYLWTGETVDKGVITGISGVPIRPSSSSLTIEYAVSQTTSQSLTYFLSSGSTYNNYKYPSDIEYYQVITGITVSEARKLWSLNNNPNYFSAILMSLTDINWNLRKGGWGRTTTNQVRPSEFFTDFDNQYITILQRGVDPYSPKYVNQYGLGKIFGLRNESDLIITASTRLNVPIQKLNAGGTSVQKHTQQNNIYNPSYFFLPGDEFSAFTTSNVGYYGALDGDYGLSTASRKNIDGVFCVVTKSNNEAYYAGSYKLSEDLSGAGYYYNDTIRNAKKPKQVSITYNSPSLYPTLLSSPMIINTKTNNIMRTDRLPSSDYLDSSDWSYNPALLQQNLGFAVYIINTDTEDFTSERFGSGAQTYSPDIEEQLAAANVLDSFDCTKMVGLKCYSGNSTNFGIKDGCNDTDTIENGCYVFMDRPLIDLTKDLKSFGEWGYRFRFFYGLCRGVLSQMFVNNWVNGTLYSYPIQVDTYYDSNNKPLPPDFCKDLIHFDSNTNNFYYRSSPYNDNTNQFIGKPTSGQQYPVPVQRQPINDRNLLYPTTIINLGMKNSFYSEITFDPSTRAYVMDELDNTSYSDMSDLVNLFVISRITDEKFLAQLFSGFNKNNSLDQLFTRDERRIDGDLAQLMSINSEEGVINFSPEYYSTESDSVVILNSNSNEVTMGVFFSSTTEDLQFKDYLTPGRINFRGPNNQLYPYPYGIKSQVVPFYQWKLNNTNTIFGNQDNSWATNNGDIFSREYQSLDRTSITTPSYFRGSNTEISDTFARGYIFNTIANSPTEWSYSLNSGNYPNKFLVGAPFHFYFGLIKGDSALDKFKRKYSNNE